MTITRRDLFKAAAVTAMGVYIAPLIETTVAEGSVVSDTCCACYGIDPNGTFLPYATGVYSEPGADCYGVCQDASNAQPGAFLRFTTSNPHTLGFSGTTAPPHPGCSYEVSAWYTRWLEPQFINDTHGNPHVFCPPKSEWPPYVTCHKGYHHGYDGS